MLNRKIQLIGKETHVSLRDYGIYNVPAKIDTGADSSAIWASNIKLKNGVLSFTLLGKTSPYFSGFTIKTKNYKVVRIINSFGHVEKRFTVNLKIQINGRKVKARFSLSDRSAKKHPVLIGRRLLRNRFLVHVSFNHKNINSKILKEVVS